MGVEEAAVMQFQAPKANSYGGVIWHSTGLANPYHGVPPRLALVALSWRMSGDLGD